MKYFKNENNELFAFDKENSNTKNLIEITFDEVEAITNRKQIEIENNKTYVEKRIDNYPSMADQLDMQYWDIVNGTSIWKETIKAIKDKYPKPE